MISKHSGCEFIINKKNKAVYSSGYGLLLLKKKTNMRTELTHLAENESKRSNWNSQAATTTMKDLWIGKNSGWKKDKLIDDRSSQTAPTEMNWLSNGERQAIEMNENLATSWNGKSVQSWNRPCSSTWWEKIYLRRETCTLLCQYGDLTNWLVKNWYHVFSYLVMTSMWVFLFGINEVAFVRYYESRDREISLQKRVENVINQISYLVSRVSTCFK